MTFQYDQPVRLLFGTGAVGKLSTTLDALGISRALLVCDDFLLARGHALRAESGGRIISVTAGVRENPTTGNVDTLAAMARETGAQAIIAMGGGSVLDAGKMAGALAAQNIPAAFILSGEKRLGPERLPVIAMPTTAGTGSEVTMVSVLSDAQTGFKAPVGHPCLFPTIALVDPTLTATVPPAVTAATGMDALSHALEAYWSIHHQPICDALAQRACKMIFECLEAAYHDGGNLAAREGMSEGALLAGLAFAQAKTAGVHACSYPLTIRHHLSHGAACALTLDAFTRVNSTANGRLDALAWSLGFASAGAMADRIHSMKTAMGLPCTLAEAGIQQGAVSALAEEAMTYALMGNNPVPMDTPRLTALLEALA